MNEVFQINIRNHFPTEKVVEELVSLGYKAEEEYGISLARVFSNCPQDIADRVVNKVEEGI